MKTENVKGFKDSSGEEAAKKAKIKRILMEVFERYGFEPAETPIVEYEEFVKGENQRDEAVSDVFRLQDKGKRELALRYEFTFQLKRLAKNKKLPYKRYQIGEVFRDEPVSSNRLRQFTQCDVDVVGSTIKDEAEILAIVKEIFTKLRIKPIILVNSRNLLREILDELGIEKNREQILREIDKIDKLSETEVRKNLKALKADMVMDYLKKGEQYFKLFKSYQEVLELMKYCKYYGVKVLFSPSLVRGLSYYNENVFEVRAEGIKETLVAGGSYPIEGVQSTGISFGLERIAMLSKEMKDKDSFMIVSLGKDKEAIKLAQSLREKGKDVVLYYGKPSKALDYANSKGIQQVVFLGPEEVKKGKFKVKDMKTGGERLVSEKEI
jgi:histidyl-tRNA synthetase